MNKIKLLFSSLLLVTMSYTMLACTSGEESANTSVKTSSENNQKSHSIFSQEADYSPRNGVKREWNKVSSYLINYGPFQEEMLLYDVAIIGRNAMKKDDMAKFKEAGVWTIEYISLGEDYSLNIGDGLGPGGYGSYYLYDEGGQAIPNGDWGSYYVNPASPAWKQIVFNEIRKVIANGADGVFMDTVDSIDAHPQTKNAMYNLIFSIRKEFPNIKLVLNRGFTGIPTLYECLDGVMFELYSTYYNQKVFKYDIVDEKSVLFSYNRYAAVQIINACRQKKYFPVFAMEYFPEDGFKADKQEIYNRDWMYDFIPYINSAGRTIGGSIIPYDFRPTSHRGIKALTIRDDVNVSRNGDISKNNLAYEKNGAKVTVDSVFNGYSKAALIDGYISNADNFDSLGWQFANWASSESEIEHYVEIELPEKKDLTLMKVHWAYDNGDVFSSKNVTVEIEVDGKWIEIGSALDIENNTYCTDINLLNAKNVKKIRLHQAPNCGPISRRNLMWISEIELY